MDRTGAITMSVREPASSCAPTAWPFPAPSEIDQVAIVENKRLSEVLQVARPQRQLDALDVDTRTMAKSCPASS
jgi:hypothetical protein